MAEKGLRGFKKLFGAVAGIGGKAASALNPVKSLFGGGAAGGGSADTAKTVAGLDKMKASLDKIVAALEQTTLRINNFMKGSTPSAAGSAGLSTTAPKGGGGGSGLGEALSSATEGLGGFTEGLTGALGGVGAALGPITIAVGGVVAAIGAAVASIGILGFAMKPFVEALNPSAALMFDKAIRDLSATIGTALEPAFQIITSAIREFAGVIYPAMIGLRPVLAQLTQLFLSVLMPVIQSCADTFAAFLPKINEVLSELSALVSLFNALTEMTTVLSTAMEILSLPFTILGNLISNLTSGVFQVLSTALDSLTEIMTVVNVIMKAFITTVMQFVASVFGGGVRLTDIINRIKAATLEYLKALVTASIKIARLFGATGLADNITKAIKDMASPKEGASAAIQGAGISSFEQMSKDLSVAASAASGSGQEDKPFDLKALGDAAEKANSAQLGALEGVGEAISKLTTLFAEAKTVMEAIRDKLPSPTKILATGQSAVTSGLTSSLGTIKQTAHLLTGGAV